MKLTTYATYEQYIESQRITDAKKSPKPALRRTEVSDIADWLRRREYRIRTGMCHGARAGHEVDWYQEEFPRARIWGTDLFLKGHPKVVEHDFAAVNPKWVSAFNFIYSNALDHARDPVVALSVWVDQLKPSGYLLIQWSRYHVSTRRGDCFGAEFHEYISLLNNVAEVVDVIYHYRTFVTIISRKKPDVAEGCE